MSEWRKFHRVKGDVEALQRHVFARLSKTYQDKSYTKRRYASYEEAADLVQFEDFATQSSRLESTWKKEADLVWQPTSGSTGGRKWIPYSKEFRADTQRVAALWLADLGRRHPGILRGSHYWSLSWLPDELRERGDNDDSRFLPWWQRALMTRIFAVPGAIQNLKTNEETWFATLVYLANDETLALMSVWSPTFALRLLDEIRSRRDEIVRTGVAFLRERGLPASARRSTSIPDARDDRFFEKLWPRLALISSWDSATSAVWADQLRSVLPRVPLQGKGLWATEGPVSIPFGEKKVLCAASHFFEFKRLASDEILPMWKLEKDDEVQPILWSSNGLKRLPLPDRVRVTGFEGSIPCIEFLARLASTDLVGEKIEATHAIEITSRARAEGATIAGLFAVKTERRYVLAVIGRATIDHAWFETELRVNHHYALARELGQLGHARVRSFPSFAALEETLVQAGFVRGQIKIEALRSVEVLGEQEPKTLGHEMGQAHDH